MKMNPFVFCLLLLAGLSHLSAQPAERYVSRKDTPIGIDQARSGWLNNPARADSATGFDIQKYEIFLNINHTNHYIQGNVLATVLAEENLSSIQYNLEALTVTQVLVDGTPVAFTHQNGLINIPLNVSLGQIFTTNVHYQGNPQLSPNVYSVGMIFSTNSLFTISDPDAGRYWWPSYDHPWDKAIVDLSIRLRSDWKVAANGLRESITDHGDGSSTTVWRGYNPMTTYLVCITCGPYVEVNQSAGDLPIQSFVYQNQYNNALIDLAYVPQMINFYSQVFGDYPFEKYGHAVVSMSTYSAMEHQTMTTLGNFIINGQGTYELIIAHELAHQWFGNCLSFLTFKDVWLSEGFATYSEHLWTDKRQGWQAACDYVNSSFHQYYLTWENSAGAQTIYNPTFNNYFSPATYEKAASVLHMLRLKVGNDHFFEILQTWFSTYHNQNVDTADFQAVCEQVSGLDLDQFFQQWIFSPGVPSVELSVYTKSAPAQLKVIARTTSPTSTQFHLDIPLKMNHSTHSDSLLVQANPSGAITLFEYDSSTLSSVQVDPNSWVLLRGKTLIEPVLSECLPSSGAVLLSWDSFANASGYRLYRKTATGEDWVLLNPEPLTDLTYTDTSVQNGTLYH
ncbi:MAG: M1 family aminopeptidase, partial [Candidatus Cloacimonetes bacterium]|nr:M1 family aminopeptidase [Candidatus Cloacimonadota bacterium]